MTLPQDSSIGGGSLVARWREWLRQRARPRASRAAAHEGPTLPPELEPSSAFMDACRTLHVNLRAGSAASVPALLFIGFGHDSRDILTAAGVALSLAESGQRTLLVDANMRKPALHTLFQIAGGSGLANMLEADPSSAAPVAIHERCWLLTAGTTAASPAMLLRQPSLAVALAHNAAQFDAVVYAAAYDRSHPDALLLAQQIGKVVLTLRAGMVTAEQVVELKQLLERANIEIAGFALLD